MFLKKNLFFNYALSLLLARCIYLLSCCRFVYMSHIVGLISLPSVFIDPSILTFHLNGIIRYVALCVWILSFSIMFSRLVFCFLFHLPCRGTSSSPLSTPFPFVLVRRMIVGTRSWLTLSFLFAFWPNHPPPSGLADRASQRRPSGCPTFWSPLPASQ